MMEAGHVSGLRALVQQYIIFKRAADGDGGGSVHLSITRTPSHRVTRQGPPSYGCTPNPQSLHKICTSY
ncbi:hypothetical protein BAUCODRAFT_33733 [Baudoinia panamericana UAMH 10762]|uniref:Uncharacterized protein n=1 Tax=Baudoinia panamericana (strain UAMH 10762) TaxID=717646 RepID=M2NB77_BAUPA|nr:uncharacterized protein BAUCODRAFT_33733 [Baudoinia panamericana UAMH 10762]EMC96404.1 hypothetical protein BAUCODRAFT_33733 [Baudoinia panamericana UAMH 10762]